MNGIRLNESVEQERLFFHVCFNTRKHALHTAMHVVCRQVSCNKYRARSRDPLFCISLLKCVRRLFRDLSTGSQSGYFAEHYLKFLINPLELTVSLLDTLSYIFLELVSLLDSLNYLLFFMLHL